MSYLKTNEILCKIIKMKLEDHSTSFKNAIFKMVYKKYSDKSKYQRILSAIVEGTVDKLDKI